MRVLCLLVLLLLPGTLSAGAWPREAGTVFTASGIEANRFGSGTSFYGEYGLRPRVTLTLASWYDDNRRAGTLALAARWHPERTWRDWRFGLTAGIGVDYDLGHLVTNVRPRSIGADQGPWLFPIYTTDARLREPYFATRADVFARLGAHMGRGTDWGWLNADVVTDIGAEAWRATITATAGYRATDRWTLTAQTTTTLHSVSATDLKLSGAVARSFGFGEATGGIRYSVTRAEPSVFAAVTRSF